MDKRKISEDVYERYVDASVALFMEYYAASCLDGSKSPHADGKDFPADLDTRCRSLINRECTRQRRRAFLKSAGKCLGAVACLAIFLLSLSSVLFMTVEAVRIPVINYYIEQGDSYWEISNKSGQSSTIENNDMISLSNPLGDLIPNEYVLKTIKGDALEHLFAIYENPASQQIIFSTCPIDDVTRLDTENSKNLNTSKILGYPAVIVEKDSRTTITWVIDNLSLVVYLEATGITSRELAPIAEQLTFIIAN